MKNQNTSGQMAWGKLAPLVMTHKYLRTKVKAHSKQTRIIMHKSIELCVVGLCNGKFAQKAKFNSSDFIFSIRPAELHIITMLIKSDSGKNASARFMYTAPYGHVSLLLPLFLIFRNGVLGMRPPSLQWLRAVSHVNVP